MTPVVSLYLLFTEWQNWMRVTLEYLMKGKVSMHKADELIFERINIEQLKETPHSISVEDIHFSIQMTNNDEYIVYTPQINNYIDMCIILCSRETTTYVLIEVFSNRIARRFAKRISKVCKAAIYQSINSSYYMDDIEFEDF